MGSGDLKEQYPSVAADYDSEADEYLSVELHDARNGAPEFRAVRFLTGTSVQALTQVAPPAFGVAGVRYRYQRDEGGRRLYGEVVGWRHGGVVVAMQFEGPKPDACVCDHGRRQHEKLVAAFP